VFIIYIKKKRQRCQSREETSTMRCVRTSIKPTDPFNYHVNFEQGFAPLNRKICEYLKKFDVQLRTNNQTHFSTKHNKRICV